MLFCVFCWASHFSLIRALSPWLEPATAAAIRFSLACLILLLYQKLVPVKSVPLTFNQKWQLLILGVVGISGQNIAIFAAMDYTTEVNGAIILSNLPVMAMLLSMVVLRFRPSRQQILGLLLGVSGVIFVVSRGNFTQIQASFGDTLILLGLCTVAFYTVFIKKWMAGIPVEQTLRWTLLTGTAPIIFYALAMETSWQHLSEITTKDSLIFLFMAAIGTVIGFYIWIKGTQIVGPEKSSSMMNLMPVFAVLISLFQGALPNQFQLIGMCLVMSGVFLINFKRASMRTVARVRG
ncbi:DMT family transporter [Thaumasiovibrio subtropicus]|nr:DMT family transporter [Thaumasiovibrio subtropicus]